MFNQLDYFVVDCFLLTCTTELRILVKDNSTASLKVVRNFVKPLFLFRSDVTVLFIVQILFDHEEIRLETMVPLKVSCGSLHEVKNKEIRLH